MTDSALSTGSAPMKVNSLQLMIERIDAPAERTGRKSGYFYGINIHVDGELIRTYATCIGSLASSTRESGEFFFNTCSCGEPGCVNVHNGVLVQHDGEDVIWYASPVFGYVGKDVEPLQHRTYRFNREQYATEIKECLEALIAQTEHLHDKEIYPVYSLTTERLRESLQELMLPQIYFSALEPAQDRLWHSIEKQDRIGIICALTDGAGLLLEKNEWTPWDMAVGLYGRGNRDERDLLEMLVRYLPPIAPVMEEDMYINYQEWALKHAIECAHAEIFLQLAKPDGPVPLTEKLLACCNEEMTEHEHGPRAVSSTNDIEKPVSVSEWCDAADRRRHEFEFHLMREAIDKAAELMRGAAAVRG